MASRLPFFSVNWPSCGVAAVLSLWISGVAPPHAVARDAGLRLPLEGGVESDGALRKALIRFHFPFEVMLTCVSWYVVPPRMVLMDPSRKLLPTASSASIVS